MKRPKGSAESVEDFYRSAMDAIAKVYRELAQTAADQARVTEELLENDDLIVRMAKAEARYLKHIRNTREDPDLLNMREFISESDDAIFAPSVILALITLRESVRRLSRGNAQEKVAAVPVRRRLEKLLLAYARPGPSRETRRAFTGLKLDLVRMNATADVVLTGGKLGVALARHAADVGAVAQKGSTTRVSRAVQRAEQRERKQAGQPPRPRGRPARPR